MSMKRGKNATAASIKNTQTVDDRGFHFLYPPALSFPQVTYFRVLGRGFSSLTEHFFNSIQMIRFEFHGDLVCRLGDELSSS